MPTLTATIKLPTGGTDINLFEFEIEVMPNIDKDQIKRILRTETLRRLEFAYTITESDKCQN